MATKKTRNFPDIYISHVPDHKKSREFLFNRIEDMAYSGQRAGLQQKKRLLDEKRDQQRIDDMFL